MKVADRTDDKKTKAEVEVEVRFCYRCKWTLRATWMATEILQSFAEDLTAVKLVPSEPGIYQIMVKIFRYEGADVDLNESQRVVESECVIWDRKIEDGFPYPKDIKRRLKKRIFPEKELGKCVENK